MTDAIPQTMFHHHANDYAEQAAKAAEYADEKMHALFAKGRADLPSFLQYLDHEAQGREDSVVPASDLHFFVDQDEGVRMQFGVEKQTRTYGLHDHAVGQLMGRGAINIPSRFGRDLAQGPLWQRELLAHNLNEVYQRADGRVLVRAVHNRAKGVMSDRYAIMDTRPLLAAFAEETTKLGAVPIMTHRADVRNAVKVMLPQVFAPMGFERLGIGLMFRNSDYGAGALDIRVFVMRLWCTNFATMESELRRVHLGSQMVEGIALSHETHSKVRDALTSAIRDIVAQTLTPEAVESMMNRIKAANAKELGGTESIVNLLKGHFGAKKAREIVQVYSGAEAPIEALPPGGTQYRLAQAVGWWAQQQQDVEDRVEAELVAGKLLAAA
jgi:hypothetical protein